MNNAQCVTCKNLRLHDDSAYCGKRTGMFFQGGCPLFEEEEEFEWTIVFDEKEDALFRKKYVCSKCGGWNTYGETKYCPECGAKMITRYDK